MRNVRAKSIAYRSTMMMGGVTIVAPAWLGAGLTPGTLSASFTLHGQETFVLRRPILRHAPLFATTNEKDDDWTTSSIHKKKAEFRTRHPSANSLSLWFVRVGPRHSSTFHLRRSSLPAWVSTVPLANRFNRLAMVTYLCTCRYVKTSRDNTFGHRADPVSNDRRMCNTTALLSPTHALHLKKKVGQHSSSFLPRSFGRPRGAYSFRGFLCHNKGDHDAIVNDDLSLMETTELQPGSRRKFLEKFDWETTLLARA
jgi:hypothetical protein